MRVECQSPKVLGNFRFDAQFDRFLLFLRTVWW
jgi:hypothetical protein